MASNSNADIAPINISGPLLIGILLSTLLFGIVLGLSFQYLSAVSRISKLAPEPCLARKSSRPRLIAILNARLKRRVPSFLFGEHAFRTFTVLVIHIAGSSQTIIRFYVLWQLAIVQSRLDFSLNPLVIPFGVAISSNLLTLMIQTIVQISLLGRAQKLDRIATYSAVLATERDQNRAISLPSDIHSIRIEPGEEEDNEWLVILRQRRLMTHSLYLQQGSSTWLWKALQLLVGICAATGITSAVLNAIGPFERHQGITLSNTSSVVKEDVGRVGLITPIWYMLSAVVDVLISASTIRDLGRIRNQVLNIRDNTNDYVSSLRSLAVVMLTSGVLLSGAQIVSTILYFSLRERGWQYVPISILPRFYEITLIVVLSTSLKSQEARNSDRPSPDVYHLKSSSVARLSKSSITDPGSERHRGTRPPRSLPAAMIRGHSNLSLTYNSSDTHLDRENVMYLHYNDTSHTGPGPPQLRVSSQSPEPSLTPWCTFDERRQDPGRLSPNSPVFRLSASTINSKPEYPLHSRFSDWGTATPETTTCFSRSTMS